MNKEKGFTLIEIIIVVAIIALLAAIAIPEYLRYQSKSKIVAALAEASALRVPLDVSLNQGEDVSSATEIGGSALTQNCAFTVSGFGASGVASIVCEIVNGSSTIDGMTITLSRTAQALWACNTTAPSDLAPVTCPGI